MCGIAGFVGKGSQNDLERMIAMLKHRGPDHQGVFVSGEVGLAGARLAIIDLSPEGNQPMADATGKVRVVFNGEIYNFQTLREEIGRTEGYPFATKTDTEVILAAYRVWGERCFEKLDGMFAIALYDFEKNRLLLARDRMGKKPLYIGLFGNTLVFGSELKSLFAHPSITKDLDHLALAKYLQYEYVPTPQTILKGIQKLEPATCAVWENGGMRKIEFWQARFSPTHDIPLREALEELDRRLNESVSRRLVADVPVGIFLSGGIDSSTVAYYAQKNHTGRIRTFSIGFDEQSYDELPYAHLVARFLGTDHLSRMVTSKDMLDTIPRIVEMLDEPLADVSIIPTYLLSEFARGYVTVALGGDGADELFAGYSTFQAESLARIYARTPVFIRRSCIEPLIRMLPVRDTYFSWEFKLKKFLDGFTGASEYRHQLWLGSFAPSEQKLLLAPAVHEAGGAIHLFEDLDRYQGECNGADPRQATLYCYQRTYMMDGVLAKVDRASMAASLEMRSPFLDTGVVEFANRLPYELKYRGMHTKFLLKKLMEDKLPRAVVHRSKKGFGIPLGYWLKHQLRDFARDILTPGALAQHGLFNSRSVEALLDAHDAGQENNAKKLWTLLAFQLWHNRWFVSR